MNTVDGTGLQRRPAGPRDQRTVTLTLALLVPGIAANDEYFTLAAHHFAILANAAHTGANLHARSPLRLLD
jgi:hypothetical protein